MTPFYLFKHGLVAQPSVRLKIALVILSAALHVSVSHARVIASFADIAENAIPGVVNIRTTSYIRGKEGHQDPYQFFLGGRHSPTTKTNSLGSGVIIDQRGFIVTNYHVIKGASAIDILFAKTKNKVRGEVVGVDPKTDMALLKVKLPKGVRPLDLGDSDKLRVGDIILAIGNPFGYAHTVTHGIISAKGRVIGTGPYDDFLQTDAPINPGNSGGPLIDLSGRVIGIATAVATDGPGIGFAIPINIAKDIVTDLMNKGKVIRPWVGLVGKNILSADEVGDAYDPSGVFGVLIDNLVVDGPAHQAGLRMGDLILGIGATKIFDLNHLQRVLSKHSPREQIALKVYRSKKGFLTINLRLGEQPTADHLPDERDLF